MIHRLKEIAQIIVKKLKEINIESSILKCNSHLLNGNEYEKAEYNHEVFFHCNNDHNSIILKSSDCSYRPENFDLSFSFQDPFFGPICKTFYNIKYDNCWQEIALIIEWLKINAKV